jgi:predicted Zn-dependent peptidase
MTPELTKLANGLRVVSVEMPQLETVSLGVWVAAGARNETEAEHGLSHFLEHMAFKGTARRSARAIAEEIEAIGGELNAATGLEQTFYFARVLKGDEGVALDILADILLNSAYAEEELEREREVILQEIASILDSPDEVVYDLVHEAAYPGQAVGRPIIGTPASVRRLAASDMRTFLAANYRPDRMIIAAAGAVSHGALVRHAEALFGGLTVGTIGTEQPACYEGGIRTWDKPFEQSHIVLAFEGPSCGDRGFFTAQVFSGLFGGGMSSRLFQEVRERRGLCYAIYSSAWGLRDTGMLAIHAATAPNSIAELIGVVESELQRLAEDGPTPAEVARAKAQLRAGLLMSLESSSARAEQMARQLVLYGRILTAEELIQNVCDVTAQGIAQFAAALMAGRPSVAVVGAGRKSRDIALRVERLIGV